MAIDTLDHTHAAIKQALCNAHFFPHFIDRAEFPTPTPKHLVDIRVSDAPIGERTLQVRFPNFEVGSIPIAIDNGLAPLIETNKVQLECKRNSSGEPGHFTFSIPEANWAVFTKIFTAAMVNARAEKAADRAAQALAVQAATATEQPTSAVEGDGLTHEQTVLGCALQNQTRIM